MASLPFFRPLARPKPFICQRCIRKRHVSRQWNRNITQAKLQEIQDGEAAWKQRAEEIKSGRTQSMLSTLEARGFIKDVAGSRNALDSLMTEKRVGAYVGIDPTAPSLHAGHLLPFMALFWMYVHGFHAVTLIGGMTARVGDPSGRSTAREEQTTVAQRLNPILMTRQLKTLWTNVESLAIKYDYKKDPSWKKDTLNNRDWLVNLGVGEFLSDMGHGIRLGAMLNRDTVRMRMESGDGMSFSEFCYPLLQAWDWWTMYNRYGVQLQIGGSDQYGNICAGMDTINYMRKSRRNLNLPQEGDGPLMVPAGFTTPLLTTSSGEKFGKSAGNAVWLDPDMLSSFDLYQYFMRTSDADVEKYLKLLTFVPLDHIRLLMNTHRQDASKRLAQRLLARELVELAHGASAAVQAEKDHHDAFSRGTGSMSLSAIKKRIDARPTKPLSKEHLEHVLHKEAYTKRSSEANAQKDPSNNVILPKSLVFESSFPQLLYAVGLVDSKSEGHRQIMSGGVYSTVLDPDGELKWTKIKSVRNGKAEKYVIGGEALALRTGKSKITICRIVDDEQFDAQGFSFRGWEQWKNRSVIEA